MPVLGETVRCDGYEVRVLSFEPFQYVGDSPPPEGTELWAALVELVNLGDAAKATDWDMFYLYDREHFAHRSLHERYCREPHLPRSRLAPGGRVRGYATVRVPKGTVPARLSFVSSWTASEVVDFVIPPG